MVARKTPSRYGSPNLSPFAAAGPREDRALAAPSPNEYPRLPDVRQRAGVDNGSFAVTQVTREVGSS